jgi:hypothetical protein
VFSPPRWRSICFDGESWGGSNRSVSESKYPRS